MIKSSNIGTILVVLFFVFAVMSCSGPDANDPGTEYMPDMGHSIAYEANHYDYYSNNTWGSEEEYHKFAQPRKPVEGTVPRGYAGTPNAGKANWIPVNGSVPYYYADTEEERIRATEEINVNPFPITDAGLAVGKNLYNINCGICHGKKGDGNGWIVAEENPNAKYPAQPASFLTDELIGASPGRYYHSIMWGKNVMGHYKDKLSYEERWHVIHYIRSLQAKEKKLVYSQSENTLNAVGVPGGSKPSKMGQSMMAKLDVPMLDHHGDDHHEGDHGAHSSDAGHGEEHSDAGHSHDGDHDNH